MKNSVGWGIAMNVRIVFKLHTTATPGFHSLYDWCFQMMWQFSGSPVDPEDDTMMQKYCAKALHCSMKSLLHTIWTEHHDANRMQHTQWFKCPSPGRAGDRQIQISSMGHHSFRY
jgi:hypothetical protein